MFGRYSAVMFTGAFDDTKATAEYWPLRPENELLPAAPLRFRVRASNGAGAGAWSEAITVSTDVAGFCGNAPDVLTFRDARDTLQVRYR